MRYILIPVKDLTGAKQRLSGMMSQEERTRFAWSMLESTFEAAASVRKVDHVAIVTLYPPAIELGRQFGFEIIHEKLQKSESCSVDFGSKVLANNGADAVLRLPIDLPLMTSADIETILDQDPAEPCVVLVPSRDGTGTNAILRRPPGLFPSHFGPGSLGKHVAEARAVGAICKILELPRIALDIDEPEDIKELMRSNCESSLNQLLVNMGIEERLHPMN